MGSWVCKIWVGVSLCSNELCWFGKSYTIGQLEANRVNISQLKCSEDYVFFYSVNPFKMGSNGFMQMHVRIRGKHIRPRKVSIFLGSIETCSPICPFDRFYNRAADFKVDTCRSTKINFQIRKKVSTRGKNLSFAIMTFLSAIYNPWESNKDRTINTKANED